VKSRIRRLLAWCRNHPWLTVLLVVSVVSLIPLLLIEATRANAVVTVWGIFTLGLFVALVLTEQGEAIQRRAWQVDGLGFTELITFHSLDLRMLPAGAACPISPQQVAHTLSAEFGSGPAIGTSPIYALMAEMQGGSLKYSRSYNQSHYDGSWAHSKVLWMAKPGVTGTVLIRAQQIDGPPDSPQWIGFGMGDVPELALHWQITAQTGWANLPSDVRIPAPGCYAYQVDSQGTSEEIVFQVVSVD